MEWDFFYYLIDGIQKNKKIIDKKIDKFAINKIQSITPISLSILRLSTYELIDSVKKVPYQVIISEYVEHAKSFSTTSEYKFINGILEKLAKDIREL